MYLTEQTTKPILAERDRPAKTKISPAMLKAGVAEIISLEDERFWGASHAALERLATEVYAAMESQRRRA
jgi:hypothetical protein